MQKKNTRYIHMGTFQVNKNQYAASFNRFPPAPVCYVYGSSLFHVLVAVTNNSSFWGLLCIAHGTGWSVSWDKNADINMD